MRFDLKGVGSSNTGVEDNKKKKDALFRPNLSAVFIECREVGFPVISLYLLFWK